MFHSPNIPEAYRPLWQSLLRFQIGDPQAPFSFTDRLARENRWQYGFALRAVLEYKRFLFLVCTSNLPLTPSDEVDQVWHLHLLYTQSYWEELCGEVVKRPIHHGPTKGGQPEIDKYQTCYRRTLERYGEVFGKPPTAWWPPPEQRFASFRFVRVNAEAQMLLPNPLFLLKRLWKKICT